MRYILGLREEEADKITLTPALPQALRRIGATYRISPIPWGNNILGIECKVRDSKGYTINIHCQRRSMKDTSRTIQHKKFLQDETEHTIAWEGNWGEGRTLQLPQLIIASKIT
jgi:hypothetical protein